MSIHAFPIVRPGVSTPTLVAIVCLTLLSACGGGSNSSSTPTAVTAADTSVTNAGPTAIDAGPGAGNRAIALASGLLNNGATVRTLADSGAGTLTVAPAGSDGWTQCAVEGELCSVNGPMQVRYGIPGAYVYTLSSESVPCNNGAFSDPAPGAFKACSYAPMAGGKADGSIVRRASSGRVLLVGPGKTYSRPCAALTVAGDGDLVEIDAAGAYGGDTCAFGANDLTIRGVNGRPKIEAAGQYTWGKGIWVVTGRGTVIDNVEMSGAAVPDHNGAAIRLDGTHLTLRNSFIHDNENGILTANDGASDIVVEYSEFGHNGSGAGNTHNLYIGDVASLVFRFNFTHDANVGHNLKSRAHVNTIAYNRFSSTRPGEAGSTGAGQPSYEIDLPNAGTAYVIGNVIQQPAQNQNSNLLAYGMEGASNLGQSLFVVNNTFINDGADGVFILIGSTVKNAALIQNNLFGGNGTVTTQSSAAQRANFKVMASAFRNLASYDLVPVSAAAVGSAIAPGVSDTGVQLLPQFEYVHVAGSRPRGAATTLAPGAYAVQ